MSGSEAAAGNRDIVGSLWRAIAVPRFVTLAHAVIVNAMQWDRGGFKDPIAGWMVVTGIAIWTLVSTWLYDRPSRNKWPLLIIDLGVAVGALAAGFYVEGPGLLAAGATIPAFWVVSPVLAWAIYRGWVAGVFAASVVAAADLTFRTTRVSETFANVFLTLLTGGVVGYWATLVRDAATVRAKAAESAARTAERERLARAVHDGVLQVLSFVQRRGTEIGGETAELARVAGEQEVILRALVQSTQVDEDDQPQGSADLSRLLQTVANGDVSIAVPGHPVVVDTHMADELVNAVRAALQNVSTHAPGAKAYILLEDEGDEIVVSIRDDGPGIAEGRLEQAAADGRMGVSRSIVGRLKDLGGSAMLTTGIGQGTEWELRVPRRQKST